MRDANWHRWSQPRPGERDALSSTLGMGKPPQTPRCGHGRQRDHRIDSIAGGKRGCAVVHPSPGCDVISAATRPTRGNGGSVVVPSKGSVESSSGCMMRGPLPESGAEANGTASSARCRWTRTSSLMARRVVPMGWGGRWEKTLAVFCGHAGDSGGPRWKCQVRRIEDILCSQALERGCGGCGEQKRGPPLVPGLTPRPFCASPVPSRRNGGGDRRSLAAPCWPASSVCVVVQRTRGRGREEQSKHS